MTNRPSKSQLLEYLLAKRVNSTLVKAVDAVLIEQPEEPISFMVQHLLDAYPNETASVRASFLASEVEAKTEQSVTTRSRSNSSTASHLPRAPLRDIMVGLVLGKQQPDTFRRTFFRAPPRQRGAAERRKC